jgi:molecular chaperone GrpE
MAEQVNEQETQSTPAPDGAAPSDTKDSTGAPALEDVQRERDSLQDRLLRTVAEFDNYRKRMDRERRELSEYAASDVLSELLPIVDNLERALQVPSSGEDEAFRKGVELILKQMQDVLRKRGVRAIEATGTMFDPNFHNAVIHEASSEHREGEVMQELQRGYMIGDRLLRPAMVKVAKSS